MSVAGRIARAASAGRCWCAPPLGAEGASLSAVLVHTIAADIPTAPSRFIYRGCAEEIALGAGRTTDVFEGLATRRRLSIRFWSHLNYTLICLIGSNAEQQRFN